ncbi:SusC/RagA family TonB-linked outer membrane protein [Adhaeribacter aerolatus]|uniref:SusC/RagA family TonB-linked outer membrane protein n=1 Tax=Adhaeribacter aerolatus TaxID=670289 RepID=A0A512B3C6_9BACT|nr:SusC/RagA family TonB-linked outer membrane protein [Adhaeribacter aerolatus]
MAYNYSHGASTPSIAALLLKPSAASDKTNKSVNEHKAAEIIVTGRVTSKNNEGLPGVTILLKGTAIGTTTGADGTFSLKLPDASGVLVISFIGYTTQEVAVPGSGKLNVVLADDAKALEEVVVVGYGTQKKSDLTGAITSVKAEDLKTQPLTSIDQGLQGRASGVQVTQSSGQPGAVASIRIRGGNSLQGGNEPLYVIDGFPVYSGGGLSTPGTGPNLNPMASLNPGDIESIEILKDASATAIYGSRGANGVVLVTTKNGKRGRDVVSFESYYGMQQNRKKIDLLNATEFANLVNDAYTNDGLAPIYTPAQIAGFGEGTDWQEEIFTPAPIQNYQLSFSGGDEKTTYALSGGYFKQDGTLINSYFDRINTRVNLERKVNQKFNIGTHLTFNRTTGNTPRTGNDGGQNQGAILASLLMNPILPVYEDEALGLYTVRSDRGGEVPNPVAMARELINENTVLRLLGDIYGQYEIIKGLRLRVSLGTDLLNNKGNYFIPSTLAFGQATKGYGLVSNTTSTTWLNENILTFDKKINDNNALSLLAGVTFQGNRSETVAASSQGFVTNALQENSLQSGSTFNEPTTASPEWGLISYIGRANYNFKEKYLLTLTGRVDGSSRFGEGNKYGFFPSAALGYRLAEEQFIKDLNFFDDLKLRVSYGITGNQEIGQYNALATLVSNNYNFGGALVTGFRPNRVPNPDLRWEKTGQFDVGLDLGILNNRLRFTLDAYHKKTTDLLYSAAIPWTSGYATALQNIGSIENKGLELGINSDNLTGAFKWTTNFNIATNTNKVLDLGDVDFFYSEGSSSHLKITQVTRVEVGKPIGNFYGYVSDGIFQLNEDIAGSAQPAAKPGDRKYKDLNGDGKITPDGDRTVIGSALPKFFGGITNNFSWKGLELNIFAQWVSGNDILNYNRFELELPTGDQNISADFINRWTPTNPSNVYPRATRTRTFLFSDRQVEDGSFLRIKTLTLAYNVPGIIAKKIEGFKVYATAQNLLTLTKYSGFDPEVSRFGASNLDMGQDYGVYPSAKAYILGLSFNLR